MPESSSAPVQTVVVGYLPSPEGLAALAQAERWATAFSARLVVVNTGKNGDYSHPSFADAQEMDAIDVQLSEKGLSHVVEQPTDGQPPAEAILEAIQRHGADLLVIGVRRRSPVGKILTGSTAQQLLLDAPCAVLAVKADA